MKHRARNRKGELKIGLALAGAFVGRRPMSLCGEKDAVLDVTFADRISRREAETRIRC